MQWSNPKGEYILQKREIKQISEKELQRMLNFSALGFARGVAG